MATALDLLMNTKEDVNLLSEESDICTIDAKTRVIFVPSTIVVGGVQSDKNAERIKFSCPKIVGDNLDLSKFSVRINFENVSSVDFNVSIKDQYICDDVAVDGENVTFSWLIGRNAARYMGTVRFIVCAVKTDSDSNISVEWNTAIAEVPVLEGIEIDRPQIGQEEKDVINQLLELTKSTSAEAVQNVNSAKEQAIKDIQSVSQPDTTLTVEGGLAEAKATGEAIGSLKEDFVDKVSELTSTTNCKFTHFAKIVDAKEATIVDFKKYNDNEIYNVSVATGKNLLPVSTEYPSVINVSNGAVIKFTNSGIINYNGEKATGESIEQNVLDTDRYLLKLPFDAELSNKFNVTQGGFAAHVWTDDGQGNLSIEEITHGAITLKKGTIIKRIWFKANESNSIFDVAFSLVEKGEEADYTAPTLKIYTNNNLKKIKFAYGTNYVIPNFINNAKENTIVYMNDNCISKQQKFALVKTTTDESVVNIPQTISTQKFLNRDKKWNIYGKDKNLSVLKCDDVNYSCSILELCAGIVKNVTMYNATMGESNKGYCVHLDSNNLENEYVLFENCIFKSTEGISIGIGTRAGATIVLKNCEFTTEDDGYAFYIHNTESKGTNKCTIIIENCLFRTNGEICMLIQDWQGCCKNDFLFINNTFMNDDKYNLNNAVKINYHHGEEENSIDWKNLLSLNKSSHGNNISFLNAVN